MIDTQFELYSELNQLQYKFGTVHQFEYISNWGNPILSIGFQYYALYIYIYAKTMYATQKDIAT